MPLLIFMLKMSMLMHNIHTFNFNNNNPKNYPYVHNNEKGKFFSVFS